MKIKPVFLLPLVLLLGCTEKEKTTGAAIPDSPVAIAPAEDPAPGRGVPEFPQAASNITYQVIPAANNTFGYEIRQHDKPMIRQQNKPGLPGNEGFATSEQAEKVAQLVVDKLKAGQMPPTVSREEMKELGAL